ncbi:dihydrofolate reductase family protein [Microbacterium sp. 179-I 3D4 NHS]|uniref:dihydrofolate reductase family protein n=1 Tax=Microbacterium sp. 179-I 3D4 NHS TaxID=3142381 RepID=UPI00399EF690
MHTLIAVEFVSLDGIMQSPGRPDEDTSGGFTRGGWASTHMATDPEAGAAAMAGGNATVGMVFGHHTYTDLVEHWLTTPDPNPFTEVLRKTPKFVASRRADTELPHPNSTLLHGEAVEAVGRLKQQGEGELILLGSAALLHALQQADLVDGYILTILPVTVGGGKRLFADGTAPSALTLTRSVVTSRGAIVAEYRRA